MMDSFKMSIVLFGSCMLLAVNIVQVAANHNHTSNYALPINPAIALDSIFGNSSLNSTQNEPVKAFMIKVFQDLIHIKSELADLKRLVQERPASYSCANDANNAPLSARSDGATSRQVSNIDSIVSGVFDQLSNVTVTPNSHEPSYDVAVCEMKANHHIPLLNQHEITGSIKIWQRRSHAVNRTSKLYMQIRLKGFKIFKLEADQPVNSTRIVSELLENESTINETLFSKPESFNSSTTKSANEKLYYYAFNVHESSDFSRDCQSTGNIFNRTTILHSHN